MYGDTSAVKKKHDLNPMADKSEWKTPSIEGEGKGDGHQYGRKPRTPEPIPVAGKLTYSEEEVGHWTIRALSLRIMMMMMIALRMVLIHVKLRFYLSSVGLVLISRFLYFLQILS